MSDTAPQTSIISVASPSDATDPVATAVGESDIDAEILSETLEYIRPALQADQAAESCLHVRIETDDLGSISNPDRHPSPCIQPGPAPPNLG